MNAAIFIASPLVGAGIGYVTNWIAIKMLFRPLRPVRILGVELPMLQGVIPKRHRDLARSVGQTVGEHLLTEDAFEKILQSAETREGIRKLVRDTVEYLQKEERTIDQILALALPEVEKREAIQQDVTRFIANWVVANLRSEQTLLSISGYINDFFKQEHNGFADSDLYAKLKYTIRQYLLLNLQSPLVAERVFEFLNDRVQQWQQMDGRIGDLIPVEMVEGIQKFLAEQGPRIGREITQYLNSPTTRTLIKERVEGFFNQGFLMSLVGRFADKNKIVEQLITQFNEFIQEPQNQAAFSQKINSVLAGILNTRLADIARRIDGEKLVSASQFIAEKLAAPEFVDTCLDALEDVFLRKQAQNEALLEVAASSELTTDDAGSTERLVTDILREILQADFIDAGVNGLVHEQLTAVRERAVKSFFTEITLNTVEKIENGLLALLDFVHRHYLSRILGVLNFQQLVEEKILSFDLEELEALVLRVMSVELKAITLFGLYLGLLMGFITPLVNLLLGG